MSSKPWLAILSGGRIVRWSDVPPHLDGHEAVTDEALHRLGAGGSIALTPLGPLVPLDAADPRAVLAALREIDPKLQVSRDAPQVGSVPSGAVS